MASKNKRLIITLLLIIPLSYFSLKQLTKPYKNTNTILGRVSNILNKNNTIELSCEGISKNRIDIIWDYEFGSTTIIQKGSTIRSIGHQYGKNMFTIKIDDLFESSLVHFKSNNWHSHDYRIKISKITAKKYKINFIANGPDFENYSTEIIL